MYGDTGVMRRHVDRLREQGDDIRTMADQLVSQTEGVSWTGRAADAMRERIRERAAHLRDVATSHDTAADSLERHLHEVDSTKDAIAARERKATALVTEARTRVAQVASYDDPDGVRRTVTDEDRTLADFNPPPTGHKDWLAVNLPGL